MPRTNSKARFGTFAGVFTPTTLTILGLVLFLRTGWTVGQAGLLGGLGVIALSCFISLLTSLSISAVATNMHVGTGGSYYMISRTLGLEVGGAIGIPLYLSQAVSVAFYVIGFSEALAGNMHVAHPQLLSAGLVLLFGVLAWTGADFALRIQFAVLGVLGLSLVSFFAGGWDTPLQQPALYAVDHSPETYAATFAVFFPAVTGIMVGVSMSGDLRDPMRSIPRGTLWSVGLTSIIYLGAAAWMAYNVPRQVLLDDPLAMQHMSRWPLLVVAGVWVSTLSSALGSVLAAPRTLDAVARDNVVSRRMAARLGSATEPRAAVVLTTVIALCVVLAGDLNAVAPVITMFFLNTYGMINLAAGLERLVGNPSFRPGFRVHWSVSLLGAVGCYGAMVLINWKATLLAVGASWAVFAWLGYRSLGQGFGDIRFGIWYALARYCLVRLQQVPRHIRNWRPNVVVFSGLPRGREPLVELGADLTRGRGLITFCHLLRGDPDELGGKGFRQAAMDELRRFLNERGLWGFAESTIVPEQYSGMAMYMQAHGLAGLEPTSSLSGWAADEEGRAAQIRFAGRMFDMGKSTLFFRWQEAPGEVRDRSIDIWWRGRDKNAELMLLMAHMLCQSPRWRKSRIRVVRIVDSPEGCEGAKQHIQNILDGVRVEGSALVLAHEKDRDPVDMLAEASRNTGLVMVGMQRPRAEELGEQAMALDRIMRAAGNVLAVRNAEAEDVLDPD